MNGLSKSDNHNHILKVLQEVASGEREMVGGIVDYKRNGGCFHDTGGFECDGHLTLCTGDYMLVFADNKISDNGIMVAIDSDTDTYFLEYDTNPYMDLKRKERKALLRLSKRMVKLIDRPKLIRQTFGADVADINGLPDEPDYRDFFIWQAVKKTRNDMADLIRKQTTLGEKSPDHDEVVSVLRKVLDGCEMDCKMESYEGMVYDSYPTLYVNGYVMILLFYGKDHVSILFAISQSGDELEVDGYYKNPTDDFSPSEMTEFIRLVNDVLLANKAKLN